MGSIREGQDIAFVVDCHSRARIPRQGEDDLSQSRGENRSLQVEAVVANTRSGSLKPGLFARVTLYTGPAQDTVIVPVTALLYDNSATKLFVVEGDRAKERQ